ncbi:Protein CBG25361 [Caenorhabditis briggsae]|uniref:Protein CBG25361 n=1 Tax=Caenorhabditis briggsae TaxID=6238 RepID=B6IIM5_CAEBR|nr:Protein CBG25361 [Caenorhabditis briggsae]CAR99755.1 Protein CBG25361 [Caenorhabditis briggsae]
MKKSKTKKFEIQNWLYI